MIDRGGRARLPILAPPWAVDRGYNAGVPLMIATEEIVDTLVPAQNVFSFGVVAAEVRPVYLAAYSIAGGEMDNLSSAQVFCRKASVQ